MIHTSSLCRLLLILPTLLLAACSSSPISIPDNVKVIAHGGGAAHWIRNSRHAVEQLVSAKRSPELQNRFDGIEVDVVLTADNLPVLAHDPWVSTELCVSSTHTLSRELLIKNLSSTTLASEFRCGGKPDPQYPTAETREESILDLKEFLLLVAQTPELIVYLDLKIQPPLTKTARDYAQSIMGLLTSQHLRNPVLIEVPTQHDANEFGKWHTAQNFELVLSYPPYFAGENWTLVGAKSAWQTFWNHDRPVELAREANANAISSLTTLLPSGAFEALQTADISVVAFTAATATQLERDCQSGANLVITDVPLQGPCP
jgi:hypothetical protein